ncbi:hypothetical protein K504DRAFT_456530 [Pleomassaria siparia CBS 279.74]|uniref:Uncharacterized protein n=1 Tax=Pleomassaria siparia CBS 279.74 TaxID=1314801 RepID=A0A6G1JP29_9PLEO|nr:hypothetical protein K504DRAFT_456530 [Pleomassaria siparia CBS 279.74]
MSNSSNNKQEFIILKAALVTLANLKKPKIIANNNNSNFNISNSNKEVKEKGSIIRDSNSLEDKGHNVLDTDKTEILAALEAKIPKYMLLRKDAAAALKLCIRLAVDLGLLHIQKYKDAKNCILA